MTVLSGCSSSNRLMRWISVATPMTDPGGAASALTDFIGTKIAAPVTGTTKRAKTEQNAWRRSLSYGQLAEVEKVAGEELRRLGYK